MNLKVVSQKIRRTSHWFVSLSLIIASLPLAQNAHGVLLFTEEFPTTYGEGTVLGNNVTTGGFNTKWATGNGAGQNGAICTSAGAMVYPTLATITNVPSYGFRAATGTSRDNRATFASQNSGSVYVSFLLKVTAETPTARILVGMRNSTGGGNQAAAVGINASRQLTVYKNSSNASATHPTVLNQNEIYLVVFRLRFQTGADEVAVWINPTTGGVDESTAGVTPTTTTANSDASSVTSLQLLSALDSSGALYMDEFRVGTDWTDVTPQAGPLIAANLAITTLQQVSFVGEAMHPVVVQVRTAGGLDVPSNNIPVTLSVTAGSGNLNGTLTALTDANGRATFAGLSFDTLGNGKAVTASASGIGAGLAGAVKDSLWVIKNPDASTGPATSPVITQSLLVGNNFILRGNNGAPNGEYRVLAATNAAIPLDQWTSIATNNFDGGGMFDSTNSIAPSASHRFYCLSAAPASGSSMFQHMGYASVPAPITGGGNTPNIVVVTNLATFAAATSDIEPRIVYVDGTFELRNNGNTYLGPNKTIIGLGTNATLIGDLGIFYTEGSATYYATNIIIRNLHLTNPDGYGEDDCITIKNAGRHVWIDHCTMYDTPDGLFDITREADFVTISWCKFFYNAPNGHENIVLIGGNDDDTSDLGKLHVTIHHNWFGSLIKERMPSVRFGRAHVFNNYFNSVNNNYCTRTRLYAEVLVENNHYDSVFNPWELATSTQGPNGLLFASGNITNNCTFSTGHYNANLPNSGVVVLVPGTDVLTPAATDPLGLNPPPYNYTLDAAADVQSAVTTHSGAGKGPFAP